MGSGTVRLKLIWAMLDHCLPGYERRQSKHHWRISFGGLIYRSLPLGGHGKRKNPEIQLGHVNRLMRYFNGVFECPCEAAECGCEPIDCARSQIEQMP